MPMWASVTPPTNVVGSRPKASKIGADGHLATGRGLGASGSVSGRPVSLGGRCSRAAVYARGARPAPRWPASCRRRVGPPTSPRRRRCRERRRRRRRRRTPRRASARSATARPRRRRPPGSEREVVHVVPSWFVDHGRSVSWLGHSSASGKWQATKWSGPSSAGASARRLAQIVGGARAAGAEAAAARRAHRRRDLGRRVSLARAGRTSGSRDGHRLEQGGGVRVGRLRRRASSAGADLAELAEVHHGDTVADVLDHAEVVGDEHHRQAVALLRRPRAG